MNTILVPTDFSANAKNAIDYAAHLADKIKARLVLFHVYWVPMYEDEPEDTPEDLVLKEKTMQREKEAYQEVKDNLQLLKQYVQEIKPQLPVEYTASNGMFLDETLAQIKASNADLVVMGTKGASGLKEIVLGSNAADLIENSTCPVLVIPENAQWKDIQKIIFATDFHDSDTADIQMLADLAGRFLADINIVHVGEQSVWSDNKAAKEALDQLKTKVRENVEFGAISFMFLEASNTERALQTYTEKYQTDILAMATHKRTTLQKLFGRESLTQKMAYHTHIPLLTFRSS
jgi:nucleotide-binding universal stress UspA family protein